MKIEKSRNNQKELIHFLGPKFQRRYYLMMFFAIFGSFLEVLSVAAVVPVIAVILNPDGISENSLFKFLLKPFGNPSGDQVVMIVMTALGILFFLKNLVLAVIAWYQTRFRETIELFVSNSLFDAYLVRPYEWICKVPSSVLLRNLNESRAIVDYAISPRLVLTTEATVSVLLFLTLVAFEPIGSLLVVLIVSIGAAVFIMFSRNIIRRLGDQKVNGDAKRIQIAQEALMGLREIRLYGVTKSVAIRYDKANRARIQADQRYTFASTLPIYWLEMILMLGLVVLTITLVLLGRSSEMIISFLALFTAAAFRVLPSANRVITSLQALKFGKKQLESILDDLTYEPENRNISNSDVMELESDHDVDPRILLSLKNVSFIYEGTETPVLKNVDFSLHHGGKVGIVGQSGSGKTTLVSLLCGLLPPTQGNILLNGVPMNSQDLFMNLRVAYASQDPYIIDGTVEDNIRFGLKEDTLQDNEIRDLLSSLGLSDFGLSDHLSEQGRSLSGGQKQRISLARALAHKPELLILDEPTSAVDETTERLVIDVLSTLSDNCAILIVTHRPAILQICDEIFVLSEGVIEAKSL